ncbi:hypothetical protein QBC35DRAFT_446019 [Podospora australis]|uniref:Carbohydrate kinase PfkB domain-containing protein n=1 Tax=Podospora australis TaxID=1536484 RepID=A0AAN6X4G3_9PEZI|nr:hypothetical protein QBC35DRAFT_446019 [Podospora australis]
MALDNPDHEPDTAVQPEVAGAEPATTVAHIPPEQEIDFVTLGMFIIDEIHFPPPLPPAKDIIGGAGTYSALGARLFSPAPSLSKTVAWIVDRGTDFPPPLTTLISSWQTSCLLRSSPSRLTTRGWNGYTSSDQHRSFAYTTPKLRLTATDLISSPPLLLAKTIHLICSPARCQELVSSILSARKDLCFSSSSSNSESKREYTRPIFIWEPVPDLCTPSELLAATNTLPLIDIMSPNHGELAGFMGDEHRGLDPLTGEISTAAVERACEQLLAAMPLQSYTLVIRAGEKGCFIAKNGGRKRDQPKKQNKKKAVYQRGGLQHDTDMEALFAGLLQDKDGIVAREEIEVDPGVERWVPAYYSSSTEETKRTKKGWNGKGVIDPTGGGNTFLGGLAVALARGKSIEEACAWGSVAASFAIEQVGVPNLGVDEEGNETWNCVRVDDRLSEFMGRVSLS